MDKKLLLFCLLICGIFFGFSQSEIDWNSIEKKEYTIEYPTNWELDTTGRMNTQLILFSQKEKRDSFRENVNLIIQDLSGHLFTLDSYTELSVNQIKSVPNSKVFENKNETRNGIKYHKIVWRGFVNNKNLKFKQVYYLKNDKAYVLTLTCEEKAFKDYEKIGTKILNSFIIN